MPAEHYHRSARPYPERLPELEYPGHFEVRRVSSKGTITWRQQRLFLSESLVRTEVGLEEVEDGRWSIYLADTLLARYDERDGGLECL
jgi:putative transposase